MQVTHSRSPVDAARGASEGFARSNTFEVLARAGFVARGLVYGIIGLLALRLALGLGGKITNQQGAMQTVAHQPFGKILLTLLAIGLGGYSLWRLVRAAIGHGTEDSDDTFERLTAVASGLAYGALCLVAVKVLVGSAGGSSSHSPKKAAAGVLGWPGGTWIVGIAGVALIGVAIYQGYKGVSRKFLEDSKTDEMGPAMKTWIAGIGTVGHLARTVVFGLVGIFLIKAAVEFKASAAVGLDGALAKVVQQSYGSYLLALVSIGLLAFALYSLSDARYRKI